MIVFVIPNGLTRNFYLTGKVGKGRACGRMSEETGFGENGIGSHGGSLEDLVGSFDEKITACFGDLNSDVSELAPVQIRSDEELISQSRFWNDLTSSFGTVMPVDWTKTVIRNKLFLPVLNLNTDGAVPSSATGQCLSVKKKDDRGEESLSDDELVAQLDMHSIIAADHDNLPYGQNPNINKLATADEVIKEINAMMQQVSIVRYFYWLFLDNFGTSFLVFNVQKGWYGVSFISFLLFSTRTLK